MVGNSFIVLIVVGLLVPAAAGVAVVAKSVSEQRARRRFLPATATILSLQNKAPTRLSGDGAVVDVRYPTVRFVDATQQIREAEVREAVSWDRQHEGDEVPIVYDPANPQMVLPASEAAPPLLGAVGGFALMIGASVLVPFLLIVWFIALR